MAGLRIRSTATVAAAVVVLALAGCDGGDGERFALQTVGAGVEVADLSALLLEAEDIPLPGWLAEPGEEDDPTVDDTTGGVCTFDFTDVMTPEQQATERGALFSNQAQATLFQEYVWHVTDANNVLATVTTQLAACAGPYDGTSDDTTVSVSSEATGLLMPGAASSVCRVYSAVINGTAPAQGVMCLGATGERVLLVMMTSLDPVVATPQEEYVALMTAATAKALYG